MVSASTKPPAQKQQPQPQPQPPVDEEKEDTYDQAAAKLKTVGSGSKTQHNSISPYFRGHSGQG